MELELLKKENKKLKELLEELKQENDKLINNNRLAKKIFYEKIEIISDFMKEKNVTIEEIVNFKNKMKL